MSPKTKKQYEEIRLKSTTAIKEAALELFALRGYHDTSISQITRAAGVSKGLIYNYFESKEELLEIIILDAVDLMETMMGHHLQETNDPYEQLHGITMASVQMVIDNLHYWKLLTSLAFQTDALKGLQSELQKKQEEAAILMVDIFQRLGVEDPSKEAYFYGAALDGIMLHYMQLTDLYGASDAYPIEEMATFLLSKYQKRTS